VKIVIVVIILTLVGLSWFLFFSTKPLKSSSQIDKIVIFYNEKLADLLPDNYEKKEFRLTDKKEIQTLGDLLLGFPLAREPLFDSENMDDGENWLLNIYFDTNHRYLYVDKNINSSLYEYLNENYRKGNT